MSMTRVEAEAILARFEGRRVLVLGDLMVDEYVWGHVSRVSPEAPVLVLDAARETLVPGGAGNVAAQLSTLGAQVIVAGAVGDDAAGGQLCESLRSAGSDTTCVVTTGDRPTTRKTRIMAGTYQGTQQIVRVDREKRSPLPHAAAADLLRRATDALASCDALLFSDYDKGVLGRDTIQALTRAARERGIPVTANPKPTSIRSYEDVDVAQLNRTEADAVSRSHNFDSSDDQTFHEAGVRLRAALRIRNLLVTRGAQGLTVFHADGTYSDVPAHRVDVFDGTGAGDSTIAGLTLGLAAGASLMDAVALGNAAGGAVVRKVGVVTATREEIAALFT
jgi:D-beta-D-heptose 7-phosphate kinase/D-beta-D-heptose 1-phosphate adenosyltransferase